MSETSIPTYADFVRKLFNKSDDRSKNFTHAILGIATEIHEFLGATDEVNGIEELGDLEFYLEALAQVIWGTNNRTETSTVDALSEFSEQASKIGIPAVISAVTNEMLDSAKRWVGYGKEPADLYAVYGACRALVAFVNCYGPYPCMDTDRIRKTNMAKLLKRYPGGEFDAFRAVTRDLDAERQALQGQ